MMIPTSFHNDNSKLNALELRNSVPQGNIIPGHDYYFLTRKVTHTLLNKLHFGEIATRSNPDGHARALVDITYTSMWNKSHTIKNILAVMLNSRDQLSINAHKNNASAPHFLIHTATTSVDINHDQPYLTEQELQQLDIVMTNHDRTSAVNLFTLSDAELEAIAALHQN